MIRIQAVDAQNLLEVCALTAGRECPCCNAVSIAEAKYHPELHPNAIYHNRTLVGFFLYQRAENQSGTATIRRFMIDGRFGQKGLAEEALAHILRGFRIQGVKKAFALIDSTDENAKKLYSSFGFHFAGETEGGRRRYELELQSINLK